MDTGKQSRLDILKRDAEEYIVKAFERHHWQSEILEAFQEGEYLMIQVKKGEVVFKLALLYSCATANSVYRTLDEKVDLIVLNDNFYHLESYAYGITTEVIEKSSLQKYIVQCQFSRN